MCQDSGKGIPIGSSTRRGFLKRVGQGAAAGAIAAAATNATPLGAAEGGAKPASAQAVKRRALGETGLQVSEIGFGGHSWAYARVNDGSGKLRKPSLDEAM